VDCSMNHALGGASLLQNAVQKLFGFDVGAVILEQHAKDR
jgi:hypothetical protein